MPDPDSYLLLPGVAGGSEAKVRFICDVVKPDGSPYSSDPRTILKKALSEAADLGHTYYVSPEMEFFLFPVDEQGKPKVGSAGNTTYFSSEDGSEAVIRQKIVDYLSKLGFHPEMGHGEVAEHQHEIDLRYSDALTMADRAVTFKHVAKKIAATHGYVASFMPKPVSGVNGSGMHVHQSLFRGSKNAFYSSTGLSKTAKYFIAGQLSYMAEIIAILAPTVNSYKRLVPGFEAPTYICWGYKNRSALIRVPGTTSPFSTRIEARCPDPSSNPYLVFAALLKAGLKGMSKKLSVPKPVETSIFSASKSELAMLGIKELPESLGDALTKLESSMLVEELLSKPAKKSYLDIKTDERLSYLKFVSRWEVEKYL